MKLEAKGKMVFADKANKIVAEMQFDNVGIAQLQVGQMETD